MQQRKDGIKKKNGKICKQLTTQSVVKGTRKLQNYGIKLSGTQSVEWFVLVLCVCVCLFFSRFSYSHSHCKCPSRIKLWCNKCFLTIGNCVCVCVCTHFSINKKNFYGGCFNNHLAISREIDETEKSNKSNKNKLICVYKQDS